jgi:hypothetical protein
MEAGFMDEPLRRVTPGDEPLPAVALAEVPLIGVPLIGVPLVEISAVAPACGDPVAAWVWWCSGVVAPVEVVCWTVSCISAVSVVGIVILPSPAV